MLFRLRIFFTSNYTFSYYNYTLLFFLLQCYCFIYYLFFFSINFVILVVSFPLHFRLFSFSFSLRFLFASFLFSHYTIVFRFLFLFICFLVLIFIVFLRFFLFSTFCVIIFCSSRLFSLHSLLLSSFPSCLNFLSSRALFSAFPLLFLFSLFLFHACYTLFFRSFLPSFCILC